MRGNSTETLTVFCQLHGLESLPDCLITAPPVSSLLPLRPPGRGDIQPQLDSAMQDVSDKYILLEETEKQALRKALIEDRQRICSFVEMLRPVVVSVRMGVGGVRGARRRGEQVSLPKHSKSSGNLFSTDVYSPSTLYSLRTKRFPCWARSHTSRRSLTTSKP